MDQQRCIIEAIAQELRQEFRRRSWRHTHVYTQALRPTGNGPKHFHCILKHKTTPVAIISCEPPLVVIRTFGELITRSSFRSTGWAIHWLGELNDPALLDGLIQRCTTLMVANSPSTK